VDLAEKINTDLELGRLSTLVIPFYDLAGVNEFLMYLAVLGCVAFARFRHGEDCSRQSYAAWLD
jgi:hypothetical protein